jgi:RecA-family ATPase
MDIVDLSSRRNQGHPLVVVDYTAETIREREWAVHDRIPLKNVTLLSGDGGVGKSLLSMQLAAAHVLGRDWIGYAPERGPVLYYSAEEDADEICRRLESIAVHYGTNRRELNDRGLTVVSRAGMDAVLGSPNRNTGHVEPTILFSQLQGMAVHIRPALIVLDTAADCFAGNENDRSQTRQFVTLLRALAMESGAAVILVSHPSVYGTNSGSGLSGSTAWHNSVRARIYFTAVESDDGVTRRKVEFRKNNYGPAGNTMTVRWQNGVFVPELPLGSLERCVIEQRTDDLFMALLRRHDTQGRNVTDKRGTSYAPAMFAVEPEAVSKKVSNKAFACAMTRLFAAGKIKVVADGPPSRRRSKIAIVEPDAAPSSDPSASFHQASTKSSGCVLPPPL